MENYALAILVALFLAVIGVVAILEHRRRKDQANFVQLHQTISECLGSLQAIQSGSEKQSAQMIGAVARLESVLAQNQMAQEASSQTIIAKLTDATRAIQELKASLEASVKF